jgi:hypothetical protein
MKMNIEYGEAPAPMTKPSSGGISRAEKTSDRRNPPAADAGDRSVCEAAVQAECPRCAGAMHLWAGFHRCPNCGFKESCCF